MDAILSPLYAAVSWIIVQFHSLYSHVFGPDTGWAWGLSIVSLVVVIRICLIPLFVKQIKATRAMQAIQPKMKAIQERYKNDRQRQSEEMMKLYKEAGTNPFSSCLPILVQSPFFISLYRVLNHIAQGKTVGVIDQTLLESAQKARIFGAPLSVKFTDSADKVSALGASLTDVRIVTITMIILMSLSQFVTQRQLMTKNVDLTVKTPFMQQQKMLMYVFPVMFAVFGINFPVGVLVYWLTTNVWTMGQQLFVIRRNPTPGSKAWTERQDRLKKSGKLNADGTPVRGGLTSLVKGGKAEPVQPEAPAAPVVRQQPKRQTKAQRQQAAPMGRPSDDTAGTGTADAAQGAPAKAAPGGGKRPGQPGRRTPQPAGQRPKKKS
ncbi:membrane protein insertase YidC [Streptacidiphilus sp. ASG 303]|uniref:membrane protein insertase YidC n=1 Tax=Streptacidiphilus sp. ASG 303 TaxID=2896847 RepID=UPI001E3CB6B5|nr:membrane protein insertase YidC [Streptacidiphilus sp. ASG 303]MCD0482204.1 membrane protein insertase YidC [Streptacidiphilus sp. ASG 303]